MASLHFRGSVQKGSKLRTNSIHWRDNFFLGAHRMAFYVHWKTQFAPIRGKRRIFLNTLDRYMTCAKFAFTAACMERLGRSTQNFCAIIQPFTPWPDSVMEHTHISLGAILEPNGLLHLKLNTHMRCATPLLKFATASCWRWASLMCPRKCSRITIWP